MRKLSVKTTRSEKVFGWMYMLLQLFVLPDLINFINALLGGRLSLTEVNFLYFCTNFICVTLIFRKYLIANAKLALRNPFRSLGAVGLGLIAYWTLSLVVVRLILLVYPNFSNVNDSNIGNMVQSNFSLIAIGTILLVPIAEEVLFRGLLFQGIYNHNRFLAYTISAIAFSLPHVVSYIGQYEPLHLLMCFLQYIPAGLSLGWAYARADSIWAPILMHVTINMVGIYAMR